MQPGNVRPRAMEARTEVWDSKFPFVPSLRIGGTFSLGLKESIQFFQNLYQVADSLFLRNIFIKNGTCCSISCKVEIGEPCGMLASQASLIAEL